MEVERRHHSSRIGQRLAVAMDIEWRLYRLGASWYESGSEDEAGYENQGCQQICVEEDVSEAEAEYQEWHEHSRLSTAREEMSRHSTLVFFSHKEVPYIYLTIRISVLSSIHSNPLFTGRTSFQYIMQLWTRLHRL